MDEERAKAVRERLAGYRAIWPDITTEKGVAEAVKGGAAAAAYLAISYALSIALSVFMGMDVLRAGGDAAALISVNGVLAAAAFSIMWLIWKKHSIVAASLGLAWIAFEVAAKVVSMSANKSMVVAIFALIFSINGLRGTLAARRRVSGTTEPQV